MCRNSKSRYKKLYWFFAFLYSSNSSNLQLKRWKISILPNVLIYSSITILIIGKMLGRTLIEDYIPFCKTGIKLAFLQLVFCPLFHEGVVGHDCLRFFDIFRVVLRFLSSKCSVSQSFRLRFWCRFTVLGKKHLHLYSFWLRNLQFYGFLSPYDPLPFIAILGFAVILKQHNVQV